MDEIIINSVAELLVSVRQVSTEMGNAHLWARGQANSDWNLEPAAFRDELILEAQRSMLFRARAPTVYSPCPARDDLASWLVLMQHYGLPTRLLDWSESVAVALYFAVGHEQRSDSAAIFLLSPGNLNQAATGSQLIRELGDRSLRCMIEAGFFVNSPECKEPLVSAVISSAIHSRAHSQKSASTIHSSLAQPLDECDNNATYLRKLIIPNTALDSIRYDLRSLGITRSLVFPDLTNLAIELNELVVFDDEELVQEA